jgi:hypothetical protein
MSMLAIIDISLTQKNFDNTFVTFLTSPFPIFHNTVVEHFENVARELLIVVWGVVNQSFNFIRRLENNPPKIMRLHFLNRSLSNRSGLLR